MAVRSSQFDGQFYASSPAKLRKQIEDAFLSKIGPQKIPSAKPGAPDLCAIITPHAGYQYSGAVAAWAYLEAANKPAPKTIVLIGPNHRGIGKSASLYPAGSWQTPLGNMKINERLSKAIADHGYDLNTSGHSQEHSLEVQLPFIQYIYDNKPEIVAISLLNQSYETIENLSAALTTALDNEDFLIVATSDLSHYENDVIARDKDEKLIKAMQTGDIKNLYDLVLNESMSACGVGAVALAIKTCSALGARNTKLLKYETSAALTGNTYQVVGYASLAIYK